MPYLVQLHIFSGRPDPVWSISDKELAGLAEADQLRPQQLFEAHAAAAAEPAGGLGYRGFSIIEAPHDVALGALTDASAIPQRSREAIIRGRPDVERRLLETAPKLITPKIATVVRESIAAQVAGTGAVLAVKCPACHGATAPVYDPNFWNNDANRRIHNNCYNYANNQATNTFAQPGRGTGHMYTGIDCPKVRAGAVSDGLVAVANFASNIPGWYVALVIWPGTDYHWYRQDKNGCWSHKPGQTAARNTDNSGKAISDPKTCNRGPYTVFCTYMTTNKGVKIK